IVRAQALRHTSLALLDAGAIRLDVAAADLLGRLRECSGAQYHECAACERGRGECEKLPMRHADLPMARMGDSRCRRDGGDVRFVVERRDESVPRSRRKNQRLFASDGADYTFFRSLADESITCAAWYSSMRPGRKCAVRISR